MIKHSTLLTTAGILASLALSLTGCSSMKLPTGAKIYQIDIQQGNAITEEQLNKIQVGMPQNQVKLLLGNPILNDIFHKNRWDYPYYLYKQGILIEKKTVSIIFDENNQVKELIK